MSIEIKKHYVTHSLLKNLLKEQKVSIEIGMKYETDYVKNETVDKTIGKLMIIVNSNEGLEDAKDSSLYITVTMIGEFYISDNSFTEDEIETQTLSVLYPLMNAYIVQLTTNAYLPPLYLPSVDSFSEESPAIEAKRRSKAKKAKEKTS